MVDAGIEAMQFKKYLLSKGISNKGAINTIEKESLHDSKSTLATTDRKEQSPLIMDINEYSKKTHTNVLCLNRWKTKHYPY
jgi:hypothetical protein